MKNIIYTAIFDNYDELKDPLVITPNVNYFCFTDNLQLKSNVWKVVHNLKVNNTKNLTKPQLAREIKINIHRFMLDFNKALWIDANQQINADLTFLFESNIEYDFTLLNHPERNCVYKEGLACIQLNKDSQDMINAQMKKYFDNSYPEDNGLVATGLMIRNRKDNVNIFCEKWFDEILHFSHRDQLSFNYVLWKSFKNFSLNTIPFETLKENFIKCKHKK